MSVQICQGQLNKVDIFQFSCISFELKGCWAWIQESKTRLSSVALCERGYWRK